MSLRRLTLGLALAAVATVALPARGLVSTVVDDDVQPFTGLALFGAGDSITNACSGVLLGPTVFVTAGHCTEGADTAAVWFESEVAFSPENAQAGVPMSHPAFSSFTGFEDSSDVGVVILEQPVDLLVYAVLPAVGSLDGTSLGSGDQQLSFTVVGYGLQAIASFMQKGVFRFRGTGLQVDLSSGVIDEYSLQLFSDRVRLGATGACFGDAGGPVLISGTNVVAGVGSFLATPDCTGAGAYYRLDTDHAQEFIRSFLRR
jgi:hypothetical protein